MPSSGSGEERTWFVYRHGEGLPWYCWQITENADDPSVNRALDPYASDEGLAEILRGQGYEVLKVVPWAEREAREKAEHRPSEIDVGAALNRLDADVRQRLRMFDGGPELLSWEAAHRLHAGEPYIGCPFCQDEFVPVSALQRELEQQRNFKHRANQRAEKAEEALREIQKHRDCEDVRVCRAVIVGIADASLSALPVQPERVEGLRPEDIEEAKQRGERAFKARQRGVRAALPVQKEER